MVLMLTFLGIYCRIVMLVFSIPPLSWAASYCEILLFLQVLMYLYVPPHWSRHRSEHTSGNAQSRYINGQMTYVAFQVSGL